MYVCICNGYRDSELRTLASQGVRCARAAYQSLGNGPRCGRCLTFAQQLIDEHVPTGGAPLMTAAGA